MHVVFMAPHFPAGQRHFVRGLKAVGARVTGLCDARLHNIDEEVKGLLDDYEYIPSFADEEAVYRAVRRVQERGPWVHKLEATIESHMLTAARVRERTSIPGLPYDVVERCRDKALMKNFLRDRGVPCAANTIVDSGDDLRRFVREIGYPLILKPRGGAGAYDTFRLDSHQDTEHAIERTDLDGRGYGFVAEEFISGHEGFWDTLTVGERVVFEGINHYYPNVLEAMRTRDCTPMIITTNRIHEPGYGELRKFGRQVLHHLGITTAATHMEWFFGPRGLTFSEIGARPPGVNFWDVYCAALGRDLYTEWARAVCWGDTWGLDQAHRSAGGLVAIRPNRDGMVQGYSGVDEVQRRFGDHIVRLHLPALGRPTQPVEAGYLANAYVQVRHADYDACRGIMEEIGRTLRMYAA